MIYTLYFGDKINKNKLNKLYLDKKIEVFLSIILILQKKN
jgi:hypothetical protein